MAVPPGAEYAPSRPSERTTRWHGMINGIGLAAMQLPTARAARGEPALAARRGVADRRAVGHSPALVQDTTLELAQWAGVDGDVTEVVRRARGVRLEAAYEPLDPAVERRFVAPPRPQSRGVWQSQGAVHGRPGR